jgi:hypothetical protein
MGDYFMTIVFADQYDCIDLPNRLDGFWANGLGLTSTRQHQGKTAPKRTARKICGLFFYQASGMVGQSISGALSGSTLLISTR